MKNYLTLLLLAVTLHITAQYQKIEYKNENLQNVFTDLGKRFNVHFSYNSTLLADKKFTFKDKADLDILLLEISILHSLKIEYLDSSNIIITEFNKYEDKAFNDLNFLDEVIVKSEYVTFGFDQNKKDGTLSLQPSKLGVLPGLIEPDVMQSLQLLPGISSPSESASSLHIRGGTPDQNLVLFDRIKMYHPGHLFGMISPFNPYITEKVNIYRSGTSAEFGDRVAGIIDMQTTSEIPNEVKAGVGANFVSADAFVKTPILKDKIGAIVSFRRSLTDVFNSPTYDAFGNKVYQNTTIKNSRNIIVEEEQVLEDKFNFTDVVAKAIITLNKAHTFQVSSLIINNKLNHKNLEEANEGTHDDLSIENRGVSAQWSGTFSDKISAEAFGYYSYYDTDYTFTEFEDNVTENSFFKDNDIKDIGAQLKGFYKFTENQKATLGYDWSNLDVSYQLLKIGDNAYNEKKNTLLNTHNIFGEFEYKTQKLYARAGVRGSYFAELEKFTIEPRAYVDYKVLNDVTLKASAEIKHQTINQLVSFEFNNLGLDNSVWAVANKNDVKILKNNQFTGGFLFSKNGWKVDIEGYYKNVTGLSSLTKGFNTTNKNSSYAYGKSSIIGIDLLLKKRIKKFRTWLGYSFSKNDFLFDAVQATSFPGNFDQRHVLSFSNTYKLKDFQFSLGWHYATGKPYSVGKLKTTTTTDDEGDPITTNNLSYNTINGARLPNYHRLDVSAVYDFYLDNNDKIKARIGASVMNVYSQKNIMDIKYKTKTIKDGENEGQKELVEQRTIGLGFTPNIVFRVYF